MEFRYRLPGKFNLFIVLFLSIFILPIMGHAAGTHSFNFLKIQPGSRAQGMGGAFTALSSDISGIYYNPAGLAQVYLPAVMFHHTQWFQDISVEYLSGIVPMGDRLRLAGSFGFLHLPNMQRYDVDPATGEALEMGSFGIYDMVAQLGMTTRLTHSLAVGFQAKFLQEKIDDVVTNGIGFDLGLLYQLPIPYLSIGASVQNLGPGVKYEQNLEKLPVTYRLGVAYQLPQTDFTIAFDAVQTEGESWGFYPGIETGLGNFLSLRTGYQFSENIENGYSFGVGINVVGRYQLNYSFMPFGELGNTHRAEFIIRFGKVYSHGSSSRISKNPEVVKAELYALENHTNGSKQTGVESYLVPPKEVYAFQIGKQVLLSWRPIFMKGVGYNIYVRIPGKTGIVKINSTPINETTFNFTPAASDIKVEFYVTACKDGAESEFSEPFLLNYHYLETDF